MPWLNTPKSHRKLPINILQLMIPDLKLNFRPNDSQSMLQDLTWQNRIKPFSQVRDILKKTDTFLYQYLQISHCPHHNPHLLTPIPNQPLKYYLPSSKPIKGISIFYNLLHEKRIFQHSNMFCKWKQDLDHR